MLEDSSNVNLDDWLNASIASKNKLLDFLKPEQWSDDLPPIIPKFICDFIPFLSKGLCLELDMVCDIYNHYALSGI